MAIERISRVEKTFSYCYIRWDITHFSFVECQDEFAIYSSEFTVHCPRVTKWRMGLKSLWTEEETNILSFLLERLESDAGPETVRVSWRVSALDYKDFEKFSTENERHFEKKHKYEMELVGFPEIYELIADNQPDTLQIRCEMIVDHDHSAKKLPDPDIDIGLESLTLDLRRLCNRATFHDVVFKIGDRYFRGHRSILSARNTIMCTLIGPEPMVEFDGMDSEALEKVLRYLYTGNLYYVVVNPTIGLYKCIQFFEMVELLKYYARQQYFLVSNNTAREYTFPWIINDFIKLNKDYYSSDLLPAEGADEVWKLHLYARGVRGNSSDMAIYAEYVSGPKPLLDVCVEFSALDRRNKQIHERRRSGTIQVSGFLGCLSFMSRDYLAQVLRHDHMILAVTVRVSLGGTSSRIISHKEQKCPAAIPIGLFYSGLSSNMNQLFAAGVDTDIILIAQGRPFPVHRCILAARSKTFSSIFRKSPKTVMELDIKAEILLILLKYIYDGNLNRLGIRDLKQVYDTATVFSIPSLNCHCSQYLKDLLATDTVTDILVFAEDNKDQELKSAAFDFIWKSRDQTSEEASWENLLYERPALFKEIICYFKSQKPDVAENMQIDDCF